MIPRASRSLSAVPASLCLGVALLLAGCTNPVTTSRQSSLSDYLASADGPATPGAEAVVNLPLAVGVAFLPGGSAGSTDNGLWLNAARGGTVFITAPLEHQLAAGVEDRFSRKPWIKSIKLIPSFYLKEHGGFQDVDRVAALYGVDVMVLVSVNQVQFTNPKWYSWTYWTGVGAYTFKGDRNDTSTLVDAAVFHLPSHAMLFRAEGTSIVKGSATWAEREEKLRQKSRESLLQAMEALCGNLDGAADQFKSDVVLGRRKDVRLLDKAGTPAGAPGYNPAQG